MLKKDLPYGKIIKTPFSTQTLKMVPGFPVPIPGIVVLTASPLFPGAFDSDFFKNGRENPQVISHECFQRAWFSEIEVCPVRCSFFGGGSGIFLILFSWIFWLATKITITRLNCLRIVRHKYRKLYVYSATPRHVEIS
jgi:hypothetical protein